MMPTAHVNGIDIFYKDTGQGAPLVLVGGFASDHLTWRPVTKYLETHYRVIAFDNRGAGRSTVPNEEFVIEDMAKDTVALCHHLGIERAFFAGHSMGGMILQAIMYLYPSMVQAAVISQSGVRLNTVYAYFQRARLQLMRNESPLIELIKMELAWCFSQDFLSQGDTFEGLAEFWCLNPYPFSISGFERQLSALEKVSTHQWLSSIAIPTLVLTGDEDIILPSRCSQPIIDRLVDVTHHSFLRCGHLAHVEQPEAFCRVLTEFLVTHQ
ncbi:MAG: alpha/beta hydrolase [Coxiellaceae bacterium]|mgnify:CR=1 FL=1|nr:alpha/beta hydrolase [Coxiellaceae bacterium]|tara:strand:- start:1759 stop:2562 length:804 start_codon:yes stop_codon:yes gene_type:complete